MVNLIGKRGIGSVRAWLGMTGCKIRSCFRILTGSLVRIIMWLLTSHIVPQLVHSFCLLLLCSINDHFSPPLSLTMRRSFPLRPGVHVFLGSPYATCFFLYLCVNNKKSHMKKKKIQMLDHGSLSTRRWWWWWSSSVVYTAQKIGVKEGWLEWVM